MLTEVRLTNLLAFKCTDCASNMTLDRDKRRWWWWCNDAPVPTIADHTSTRFHSAKLQGTTKREWLWYLHQNLKQIRSTYCTLNKILTEPTFCQFPTPAMHENSALSLGSLGFRAKFTGKCMPKARICQLSKGEKIEEKRHRRLSLQKVSEKLWETRSWSDRLRFQQKPWEFFYPVSCLNSGWSFFVLPPGTMGFPTKNSPQNVWWRKGDLGESLRIISILHILKIHHTCFHYHHQDIWKHSAESTTWRWGFQTFEFGFKWKIARHHGPRETMNLQ